MRLKRKLTNQEMSRIKDILWKFFKNSFERGYPDNPGTPQEFDYRKKLTTKEEKIIYEAKKKMPSLQKILKEAYESIQNEEPQMFQSEYIKTHFSECVVKLEQKALSCSQRGAGQKNLLSVHKVGNSLLCDLITSFR